MILMIVRQNLVFLCTRIVSMFFIRHLTSIHIFHKIFVFSFLFSLSLMQIFSFCVSYASVSNDKYVSYAQFSIDSSNYSI